MLTLKEAAAAVADLYEAIPETYLRRRILGMRRDGTPCFCAMGGIGEATEWRKGDVIRFLRPHAQKLGFDAAFQASDHSRAMAIKMLRLAAK